MNELIEHLKNKKMLWQGQMQTDTGNTVSSGYPELDNWLQTGIPEQGVITVKSDTGIGELRLFLPYLLAQQQQQKRLLVFIAPPLQVNGEMLAEQGFDLKQVLLLTPEKAQDALWAAEQCLKSECCMAVISWNEQLDVSHIKRLQIASKQGKAIQLIFRQQGELLSSLPVTMALTLQARPNALQIQMNKRIGGWQHRTLDLNMSPYWPALQLSTPQQSNNIVPFPQRHAG